MACGRLQLSPISFRDATAFVDLHHRHHRAPQGHKFSLAVVEDNRIIGVAIVGRPVSRYQDDGRTLEITRLCVIPDLPKVVDRSGREHAHPACSFLYGAAKRATFALGYSRFITYILDDEAGKSVLAAGLEFVGRTKPGSWSRLSRPRDDKHPLGSKQAFEVAA
ncbi:XF1762 family protein [Novosphingobium colocasiae]|uniref:XF1762 family protein n=1 Tax=Novosphingobium colocasiae TaxID=1256513 RepID=UPI0035716AAF